MPIKEDDILAVEMKSVSRDGTKRAFEVYKLNVDEFKFENITAEVAKITNLKTNSKGYVINPGSGMDMRDDLVNYIYKKSGIEKGYQNSGSDYLGTTTKDYKSGYLNNEPISYNALEVIIPLYKKDEVLNKYHIKQMGDRNPIEYAREMIDQSPKKYQYLPKEVREIKEIEKYAFEKSGNNFQYTSLEFRINKENTLEAVKQDGRNLKHTSDRLKDDREVVMEAVKQDGWALKYASDRLKNDKEVVLEAVKQESWHIKHASQEIQDLCKDKDPSQTLEKAIAYEKLKTQLKPKADEKPTQKLKI